MNKRKRSILYFVGAGLALALASGAFILATPTALAACQKTTQAGPLTICLPNTEPPGQAHTSDQTPPNIPCWWGVSCAGDNNQVAIVSLVARPNPVPYGSTTTLSWTTANAGECNLSGVGAVPQNGEVSTGAMTSNRTFTLTCAGGQTTGSTVSKSVVVQDKKALPPAVALTLQYKIFRVTKTCRATFGRLVCSTAPEFPSGHLNATWSSTHATSCLLSKNGAVIATGVSGTQQTWAPWSANFTPAPGSVASDNFELTCTGPGGSSSATAKDSVHGILIGGK